MANCSRRHHKQIVDLRDRLAVIKPVGDHSKSQCLGLCHRAITRFTVDDNAREVEHLRDPTLIIFLLNLNSHN